MSGSGASDRGGAAPRAMDSGEAAAASEGQAHPAATGARADTVDLDATVKRHDADRWLAARFAPADGRRRLMALYAFNHELARAAEVASEPMIAAIRLAWWREALAEAYERPHAARRHETVLAMAARLGDPAGPRPSYAALEALVDARIAAVEQDHVFPQMAGLIAHVDATAGALARAAAACLTTHAPAKPAAQALTMAGRAWGLTGLARSFAVLTARGRAPVPQDRLAGLGLRRDQLAAGAEDDVLRAALEPLLAAAEEASAAAKAAAEHVPAALWPAVGYAALAPSYLRRLKRAHARSSGAERLLLARQAQLVWAAARGALG